MTNTFEDMTIKKLDFSTDNRIKFSFFRGKSSGRLCLWTSNNVTITNTHESIARNGKDFREAVGFRKRRNDVVALIRLAVCLKEVSLPSST